MDYTQSFQHNSFRAGSIKLLWTQQYFQNALWVEVSEAWELLRTQHEHWNSREMHCVICRANISTVTTQWRFLYSADWTQYNRKYASLSFYFFFNLSFFYQSINGKPGTVRTLNTPRGISDKTWTLHTHTANSSVKLHLFADDTSVLLIKTKFFSYQK